MEFFSAHLLPHTGNDPVDTLSASVTSSTETDINIGTLQFISMNCPAGKFWMETKPIEMREASVSLASRMISK
jgi:hypothetical protein